MTHAWYIHSKLERKRLHLLLWFALLPWYNFITTTMGVSSFFYLSILPGCSLTVYLKQFKNPLVPLFLINYISLFLFQENICLDFNCTPLPRGTGFEPMNHFLWNSLKHYLSTKSFRERNSENILQNRFFPFVANGSRYDREHSTVVESIRKTIIKIWGPGLNEINDLVKLSIFI